MKFSFEGWELGVIEKALLTEIAKRERNLSRTTDGPLKMQHSLRIAEISDLRARVAEQRRVYDRTKEIRTPTILPPRRMR